MNHILSGPALAHPLSRRPARPRFTVGRLARHLALGTALCGSVSASAWAQQAQPAADDTSLETVTVSAERRNTDLQKTPLSLTTVTGEELQQQGNSTMRDLAGSIPGLYTMKETMSSNVQQYWIRGIGEFDPMSNPSVAVYLDDVYIPRTVGGLFDLTDIQRVEVLRGPQGTLYGRNTAAGAIRYVTQEPTEQTKVVLSGGVGNLGALESHDLVSGTIVPGKLLGSFSYAYKHRDGTTEAPNQGDDINKIEQQSARAKLRFLANDRLTFDVSAEGGLDQSGWNNSSTVDRGVAPNTTLSVFPTYGKLKTGSVAFKASYDLNDNLTAKSISAYRGYAVRSASDNDGGRGLYNQNIFSYYSNNVQQEFQLAGKYAKTNFQTGLFLYHENYQVQRDLNVGNGTTSLAGYPVGQYSTTKTDNAALYGQVDHKLTDNLTGIVGGRLSWENVGIDYSNYNENGHGNPTTLRFNMDNDHIYRSFSPKVGLQYQWTPDLMQYATVSQGQKAGGFDNRAANSDGVRPFKSENVTTYETGVKSEWLDRKARVNLGVFYNDYENIQATAYENGVSLRKTAGSAHSYGFELETSVKPFPRLRLDNNVSYLLAQYDYFPDPTATLKSAAGTTLPYSPKWTLSSRAAYDVPIQVPGTTTLSLDAQAHTRAYNDVLETYAYRSPFQVFVNAAATYTTEDDHLTFGLSVHNIFDRQSVQWASGAAAYTTAFYSPPRTVMATVRYRY